jgi:urease accessory protein UreH
VLRQEGLTRCSRPLPVGDALCLVTTTLGPGFVRGDRFATSGRVASSAHLIVAAQSSLLCYGPGLSGTSASWAVERDATLELLGEPVVPFRGADVRFSTEVELEENARVVLLDLVALREPFERLVTKTSVRRNGRLIVHDFSEIGPSSLDVRAMGTLTMVGGAESCGDEIVTALDRVADECRDVRLGIGTVRGDRGVLVRALSDDAWAIRTALHALRVLWMAELTSRRTTISSWPT